MNQASTGRWSVGELGHNHLKPTPPPLRPGRGRSTGQQHLRPVRVGPTVQYRSGANRGAMERVHCVRARALSRNALHPPVHELRAHFGRRMFCGLAGARRAPLSCVRPMRSSLRTTSNPRTDPLRIAQPPREAPAGSPPTCCAGADPRPRALDDRVRIRVWNSNCPYLLRRAGRRRTSGAKPGLIRQFERGGRQNSRSRIGADTPFGSEPMQG